MKARMGLTLVSSYAMTLMMNQECSAVIRQYFSLRQTLAKCFSLQGEAVTSRSLALRSQGC